METRRVGVRRGEAGFTLIELMVVVIILGILVGFAAVKLNPWKRVDQARQTQAQGGVSTLKQAVDLFIAQHSRLPASLEEIASELDNNELPDDPWGRKYQYRILDQQTRRYEILSYGADGELGGEGANEDISSLHLQKKKTEGN